MALELVADLLDCPHCGRDLAALDGGTFGCGAGHRFDRARQGYLNLLRGAPPANADTAAMVEARIRFLDTGAYEPIVSTLVAALTKTLAETTDGAAALVDAGAGPGWYLSRLLDAMPAARGLALDVSVPAVRRAARAHPRMGAVVADTWARLPVGSQTVDAALSIFAPRNPDEFARLLRPGSTLVVVAAEPDHLLDLRAELGLLTVEEGKDDRLRRSLAEHFEIRTSEQIRIGLQLTPAAVADLVAMGPNAFHRDDPGDDTAGEHRVVTAVVRVTVARRR